ncbi:helix-turn-helix domain-containing protein [Chungangia koreensis]|uniref:Helix-turn-helix domain-containing protein n=1 Tax=Chungangia koreensis TaxID=752657 RepID=A0ABV8X8C0_9LACT
MRHVGENIKRIRKAKKMTISDLAGEQISRGMISLIENGKTQPSIERLQYLADKLNVTVSDLLGNYTKSELQQIIIEAKSFIENHSRDEVLLLISPILKQLDDTVEAAILHELFTEASDQYEEWALIRAIKIYEKNGMVDQAVSVKLKIAVNQLENGTAEEALKILEDCSNCQQASTIIRCFMLWAIAQEAVGDVVKAVDMLDRTIQMARQSLELGEYYELLQMKALLHYEIGDHESARSIVNTANTFVQTLQNESLLAKHGIFFIHLEEYYESNDEIAVELADEYVKYILLDSPLSPEQKRSYIELAYDLKARALVKMDEYNEAWELFQQVPKNAEIRCNNFPLVRSIKWISTSYQALCLAGLGKQVEASTLAKETLGKLKDRPHSSYYRFAKEVADKFTIVNR